MFVAAEEQARDKDLAPFCNVIRQPHAWSFTRVWRRHFFHVRRKLRFRESLVVIQSQYVVAIRRSIEVGIRLALRGSDDTKQLVLGELLVAFDGEVRDARLLTFLDIESHI